MQRLAVFAILALLLLTACPSGGGGTSSTNGSTTSSSGSSTAAAPPPEPVIIMAGTLGWQDWQLGMAWEDAVKNFDPSLKLIEVWTEPGQLGTVTAMPQDGEMLPEQVLVFTSGQLVGYNFSDQMPVEQFGNMKAELTELMGDPTTTPPEWALESPYFEGYKPPIAELQAYYWSDESADAVLQLMFNDITDLGVVALVNVEHFLQANKDIAESGAMGTASEAGSVAEQYASSAGDEKPATSDKSPFNIDGYSLGESVETVQADYTEDESLLINGMWATENQTGMFGVNPSNLSTPFPSIAAWFLDGELTGYIRNEEMTREEFIAATDIFDDEFGQGEFDPPEWLKDTPYQHEYQEPNVDSEQLIWDDEASRSILFALYDFEQDLATFMMFDVDDYTQALDETMASLSYGE